jgi:hypothetical protein
MTPLALIVPNCDLRVEISDMTAEAVLRTDARRQLSFLSDEHAAAICSFVEHNALSSIGDAASVTAVLDPVTAAALCRIAAELDAEIPF